ncbi:MAG: EF-hand domain-containing protein [Pseudomonadota bacterium]
MSILKSNVAKAFAVIALSGTVLATGLTVASYAESDRESAGRIERSAGGFRAGQRFARADTNGDRVLSMEEFQAPSAERFAEADANGDGNLSIEEIVAARTRAFEESFEDRAEQLIERVDANGDGVISLEESEAASAEQFSRLDRNEDGELEPRELRRGMRGGDHGGDGRRGGGDAPELQEQSL